MKLIDPMINIDILMVKNAVRLAAGLSYATASGARAVIFSSEPNPAAGNTKINGSK